MEFSKDTRVKDIIEAYPELKEKLPAIDSRFKIMNSPVGKMFIRKATLADVSAKGGIDMDTVIRELNKLISEK